MFTLPTPEDIKRYRKRLGLTQAELAKKAGVSQPLIARIESGDVDPRLSTIRKILEVFRKEEARRRIPARDIMKSPVISISPESTLKEASRLMEKYGISQLPVVHRGKQIGSICEELVVREISLRNPEESGKKKVREIMQEGFPTVSGETDISVISRLMETNNAVLVVERGEIVGIITRADMLRLM